MTWDGDEKIEMLREYGKNRILMNCERQEQNEIAQDTESEVSQQLSGMIPPPHESSPSDRIQQPTQMHQNVEDRAIEKESRNESQETQNQYTDPQTRHGVPDQALLPLEQNK